jgi:glutamate 5-kinase
MAKMNRKRWVVKAGSQMVCQGGLLLMRAWMQQLEQLHSKYNIEVIWVTSGAIAWAAEKKHFRGRKKTLPQKQALSAIGQPLVMDQYNLALQSNGLMGAQVLLTASDMQDRTRRRNLQNTLNQLLSWGVIPILNENDAVATEEIQFGDNDSLSAQIAIMMGAEHLVLLTDVDGLYDKNPKKYKSAKRIDYLPSIRAKDIQLANPQDVSGRGTGGMYSKLLAAKKASKNKIITHLVRGDLPNQLVDIANGKLVGTQVGGDLIDERLVGGGRASGSQTGRGVASRRRVGGVRASHHGEGKKHVAKKK